MTVSSANPLGLNDVVAGKNKIHNADFGIWQRGTSFTNTGGGNYTADRWILGNDVNPTTQVISQQTFTPGTAPVAGYEGTYYLQNTVTTVGSCTITEIQQRTDDVRTFAGQTVTLSFWAKADSARSGIVYLYQSFGAGGSTGVYTTTPSISYTTSWQRYSYTFVLPSISGKTIGTNSYLLTAIRMTPASGSSMQLWGVQLEAGSNATAFSTFTGDKNMEELICQKFYYRSGGKVPAAYYRHGTGFAQTTTGLFFMVNFPTSMRIIPSLDLPSSISTLAVWDGVTITPVTAVGNDSDSVTAGCITATVASGATQYRPYEILNNNNTGGYIGFNAEL